MRALTFNVTVPGFLLARGLGRWTDSVLFGRLSGLRPAEVPMPTLPGPDWLRLRVRACGICGTDLGNLTFSASPALEPFGSFPAVPGHEVVGEVEEVGGAVAHVAPGDRVVVDPFLSCQVRGFAPEAACPSCIEGLPATCAHAGEEGPLEVAGRPLARGMMMGYHRDLPGGWGEFMVAHASRVFLVDPALADRAAVLVEPLAVALHAVLRGGPGAGTGDSHGGGPVLVIGSGSIALATVWALRATGFRGDIVAQMKRVHEGELARLLGATRVVTPGEEARQALVDTGARAYLPIIGDEVYAGGGFPLVFDCVGNRGSLSQSLRWTAPRGRVVVLGCSAEISKLDLTFVWARELEVRGFLGYGTEVWRGERLHTFEVVQRLLVEGGAPVERLVTHAYPLDRYREALAAAANHRRSGALKVVLEP